ncbi:uncharacterized protein EAF02_001926 [Botrytis sinoallii]|uniref:uncharacterized protein n=1 Tax=Botrytis sinoallii TaxID=1463999 RepID=UPI0019015029|nr:uncharacterized protein EAF02_001926 [Botrytis sinoallii]KAF7889511.1 hypothetical protein EAF02_001926 [Botrytis sinoallii]
MPTNTSKLSNSNRILEIFDPIRILEIFDIFDPNQEYQSDSDDMVNVREVTVEHRQEIVQLRQKLTGEHRQEIDQARQETIQARQEIDQARQETIQARQELTTTNTKVATLEEKLIHKVARNKELKNQLRDCKEEKYGLQAQASDIQVQKLKKHIQSMYIVLAGLPLVLGLLAIVLLWKN